MAQKKPPSITRTQAREAERKILPAVKLLSQYMNNTAKEAPIEDFLGYEIPAGIWKDSQGRTWQLKVSAVCSKKLFIKDNEVKPIIRKWAVMFKVRLFLSALINKIFGYEVAG